MNPKELLVIVTAFACGLGAEYLIWDQHTAVVCGVGFTVSALITWLGLEWAE